MSEENPQPIEPQEPVTEDVPVPTEPPTPAAAPAQWPSAAYPVVAAPVVPTPEIAKTSSNAIVAIILAVVSWAVCPIVPAIVSLVFASMAAKEIGASGGRIQGDGLVTASRIVSWVNIGLWAAMIVVGLFVLVLVAVAGGMDSSRNF